MDFSNNRKYDRYELINKKATFVMGKQTEESFVLNISCGGVYFLSDNEYESGDEVVIHVGNDFTTDIKVIRREDVKEAVYARHAKYKIGSAFTSGPVSPDELYEILEIFLDT